MKRSSRTDISSAVRQGVISSGAQRNREILSAASVQREIFPVNNQNHKNYMQNFSTENLRADLHVHTYFSDGNLSPEKVVQLAKNNGVGLLAVTDHDTDEGCEEVRRYCREYGVNFVCGMEVSAYFGDIKLHTLCYGFDGKNADVKDFVNSLCQNSVKRTEDIIFKLNKCGIKVTLEAAANERFSPKTPIHAMHVARAGVRMGYAPNPFEFYKLYLMKGAPAFSKLCRPSPEQTIRIINGANGFCSLAHPSRIEMAAQEKITLIKRLKSSGLCGIEGVYSTHTAKETAYYKELAKEIGLLITGGSDAHFAIGNKSIGTPFFEPDRELLQRLLF